MRVSFKRNVPLYVGLLAILAASLLRSTVLNDPSWQWVSTTGLAIFTIGLILQVVILEDKMDALEAKLKRKVDREREE